MVGTITPSASSHAIGRGNGVGIMPNVFDHVFHIVQSKQKLQTTDELQVLIRCQFVEIYNEEIRDLFCKSTRTDHCVPY